MYENPSEKAHFVIKILVSMATMLSKTVDKIVSHYLINFRHKIFLKLSDIQKHNFKIEVTKRLSKKTLSTGYHDNGPFLKLLLYQKLIGWPSSIYVPSFMLVSKSAWFFHLFPGLKKNNHSPQFWIIVSLQVFTTHRE